MNRFKALVHIVLLACLLLQHILIPNLSHHTVWSWTFHDVTAYLRYPLPLAGLTFEVQLILFKFSVLQLRPQPPPHQQFSSFYTVPAATSSVQGSLQLCAFFSPAAKNATAKGCNQASITDENRLAVCDMFVSLIEEWFCLLRSQHLSTFRPENIL